MGEQIFIFQTQAWASWASCSKTCGGGEQERRRKDEVEKRLCNTQKCPSKCTTESEHLTVLISLYNDLNCVRRFDSLESLFVNFSLIRFSKKEKDEDPQKNSQKLKKR